MSTSYFLFGLAQAATGWAAVVFQRQEAFAAKTQTYANLGTNPAHLVVYFSRMGYVRGKALAEADRTGADVYEIRSTEHTHGTLGFWWCGRYAMHRWDIPIETPSIDLSAYAHVTICAPIWAFALAAPCAPSAAMRRDTSARPTTYSYTTRTGCTPTQPTKWTRCLACAEPA